ncbi:MAG: hypothetical protein P1V20_18950 [Verrucomicrobiales bacterium]|nr:hypothetical protein [Verrucomicrobiales bacterium]
MKTKVFVYIVHISMSPLCLAQDSSVAGRITGWGYTSLDNRLESTLPSGWEAENVTRVFAGSNSWVAMKSDRTVISSARLPDWLKNVPVRDVGWGTGWGLVATLDGKVRTWATSDQQLIHPAQQLENVVDVEAGYQCALALRADGTVVWWGKAYDPGDDPVKQAAVSQLSEFLETELHDVVAINCKQFNCAALRSNGSAVGWEVNRFQSYDTWLTETSIVNIDTGSEGNNLAITANGEVVAAGRNSIPKDLGPVSWLQTSLGGFAMARLKDGSFRKWGDDRLIRFSTEPARFKKLLLVAFGGSYDKPSRGSFVIAIEPSYVNGFSGYETQLPALKNLLNDLEKERGAAGDALQTLNNQYHKRLSTLKASAERSNRTSIVKVIEAEMKHYMDHDRPPITERKVLAPLQAKYRTAATKRKKEMQGAILKTYESGIARLQTLEEQLTMLGNEAGAEETRKQKELVENALILLKNPEQRDVKKVTGVREVKKFPEVPAEKRIFSIDDPVVPGRLVLAGAIKEQKMETPDSGELRRVIQVTTGTRRWIALRTSGEVVAGDDSGIIELDGDIPRLNWIRENTNKWYGIGSRGLYLSEDAMSFQPPVDDGKIQQLEVRIHPHNHFAALLTDGSVIAWGPNYERARFPWKLPSEIGKRKDFTQVVLVNEWVAALGREGDVVAWGREGRLDVPQQMKTGVTRIAGKADTMVALKSDGTVVTWGRSETAAVPAGLNDVVEVAAGQGVVLALRSDGTWIGWGNNKDKILDELNFLEGVRWLSIGGGYSSSRFIVGIRPDPSDLK